MNAHVRRSLTSALALSTLLTTLALSETNAHAVPEAIRPGTKAFFAGFQLGGGISVSKSVSQFKLREEFGWHFWGSFSGPAIGLSLSEAFGTGLQAAALVFELEELR